jgi:hypothetical protein
MKLKEEQITKAMHDFIRDCDADELARLAEEMFGGKCFLAGIDPDENAHGNFIYDFVPDENYYGAFEELK